ncbi:MAG: flagellar biosynthesis protein FlhB [Arcobacteraceae bacterium]|nr:flagellar biosynthesis protein FlhB [Arcobacteraceae bacterium]
MADDEDEKTEEPTSKKIEEAREKGNVGKSSEVPGAAILFFCSIYLLFFSQQMFMELKKMMLYIFSFIGHDMDGTIYFTITHTVITSLLSALTPFFILVLVMAFAFNVMQFGFILTPLKLEFSKLNPISGIKNVFSMKKILEALKLMAKLTIIIIVMYVIVLFVAKDILAMMDMGIGASINEIIKLTGYFVAAILLIIIIFAIIDFYFTKYYYIKSLKMSKQEIKDEHKQMDGNPEIKGRIRSIQMKMAMQRMMSDVQDADVVITNPTHYAVALKYEQGTASAPKVIAKGIDFIALKIKDIARENDIPIIENPAMARALHDQIEVGQEIPEEFYRAIADIFSYIYNLKKQ